MRLPFGLSDQKKPLPAPRDPARAAPEPSTYPVLRRRAEGRNCRTSDILRKLNEYSFSYAISQFSQSQ